MNFHPASCAAHVRRRGRTFIILKDSNLYRYHLLHVIESARCVKDIAGAFRDTTAAVNRRAAAARRSEHTHTHTLRLLLCVYNVLPRTGVTALKILFHSRQCEMVTVREGERAEGKRETANCVLRAKVPFSPAVYKGIVECTGSYTEE